MADDLISRSALIQRLAYYSDHSYGDAEYAYGVATREVLNTPADDAVPVVRCADCKHRCTLDCPMYHTETYYDDDGFDDYDVDRTDADGFCHLGERWDGEAE